MIQIMRELTVAHFEVKYAAVLAPCAEMWYTWFERMVVSLGLLGTCPSSISGL